MQTQYVFVWLLLCSSLATWACDACGCSAGGVGFGYIPFQQRHMIGLHYQNNQFETTHPALFSTETDQVSFDKFNTLSLWGRYYLNEDWFLSAVVPFKSNSFNLGNETTQLTGLGDIQLQGYYSLLSRGDAMSDKQLNWFLGGQLFLPTGRQDDATRQSLPNLQLGSGAFGSGLLSTISYRKYNLGISSEMTSRFNTSNKYNYSFGRELSTNSLLFYRVKRERVTLIPQLGVYTLNRAKDYIDRSQKSINILSGVSQLNAVVGVSVYVANIGLRTYYHLPVSHSISNDQTKPTQSFNIQLLYLLKSKNNENN